eukprot:7722986-Pyramimonas_sp.AAC.1
MLIVIGVSLLRGLPTPVSQSPVPSSRTASARAPCMRRWHAAPATHSGGARARAVSMARCTARCATRSGCHP